MRLATQADIPALTPIAISTLQAAYPDLVIGSGGFAEQFVREKVIVACADDASAFIISERMPDGRWFVRFLMPLTMPAQTGKDLIAFAMKTEHAVRPLAATTECYASLNEKSAIERATRDAYKIILACPSRQITDASGTVLATEIFMAASDLAKKLKVRL